MSSSQGLFGNASPTFGTPSYPTHLDMIRGSEAGLSTSDVSSYSAQETNNNVLDSLFKEAKSGLYITSQKDGELSTYTSKSLVGAFCNVRSNRGNWYLPLSLNIIWELLEGHYISILLGTVLRIAGLLCYGKRL